MSSYYLVFCYLYNFTKRFTPVMQLILFALSIENHYICHVHHTIMLSKKYIKLIQALKMNKFRKQKQLFIAEGPKVVGELLNSPYHLHLLIATDEFVPAPNNQHFEDKTLRISSKELDRISLLKTPNQVLAVFEMVSNPDPVPVISDNLTLILDSIADPGNLGTIIRTADWFGIPQIICSENCVDLYNPKVVQSTMGSLARVNIYYTPIVDYINRLPAHIPTYGAVMDGTPVYNLQLPRSAALVIGNESHGISEEVLTQINHRISIPISASSTGQHAESLNASIAAAILCSEFRRQNK